ncbi:hypothetical protein NDU88_003851 [Pleurodeles waltl]|uniref:Uncharacterized protein n=1 Tax=Pleurodeles waltl TaxID=8319 RepID=A0AAV7KW43_PLEWA|nr:hypothetical protein NDU88_003851 [Pleurodeles waltl]
MGKTRIADQHASSRGQETPLTARQRTRDGEVSQATSEAKTDAVLTATEHTRTLLESKIDTILQQEKLDTAAPVEEAEEAQDELCLSLTRNQDIQAKSVVFSESKAMPGSPPETEQESPHLNLQAILDVATLTSEFLVLKSDVGNYDAASSYASSWLTSKNGKTQSLNEDKTFNGLSSCVSPWL